MAVPKRRKSHSKTRMGRAHKKTKPVNTIFCDNCGKAALPHRVCPSCGHYQGKFYLPGEDN